MKAHIGADMASGLVHTVTTTPASTADVTQTERLLHGKEKRVWNDAGYTGANKREGLAGRRLTWRIATKPSKLKAMPEGTWKRRHPLRGVPEGGGTGKGGTSIPGNQAAVRLYEGALSGLGEEHRTGVDAVCFVERMDGASLLVGDGMNTVIATWGIISRTRPPRLHVDTSTSAHRC